MKLIVELMGADEQGAPTRMTAGGWVTLDDVSRPDLWSGTLANHPRVPASIALGWRIWLQPKEVVEHAARPVEP